MENVPLHHQPFLGVIQALLGARPGSTVKADSAWAPPVGVHQKAWVHSLVSQDFFYRGWFFLHGKWEQRREHFEYRFQGYDCHAGIRNLTLGSRVHMVSVFLSILASLTDISMFCLLGERIIVDMTISCSNSLAPELAPDNGEGRQVLGLFLRMNSCVMLVSVCAICTP